MKEYNREGFNIVISRFGISEKCVRLLDCKFWLNDNGFTLKSKNENILNTKYLGYYFHVEMQKKIYSMSCGACQKNLQMDNFRSVEIPVPSLSAQTKFISYCDECDKDINEMKKKINDYPILMQNKLKTILKK